jgi:hypothetical protein
MNSFNPLALSKLNVEVQKKLNLDPQIIVKEFSSQ